MYTSTILIRALLHRKGLNDDIADCFLRARLFNLTNEDKLDIQCYVANGMNKNEAIKKHISIKKQILFKKLTSGHYDNLLSYYR